ncbi:hypothetical protein [Corynebacterium qintianiae]|uniref:hypothetical protein n=1 Tax=Corynebacterium qintianiae TaxID=2709392 RepID=UPI0013EAA6FC|nr:hypothetical protein [Corynebacterium qintianiae]
MSQSEIEEIDIEEAGVDDTEAEFDEIVGDDYYAAKRDLLDSLQAKGLTEEGAVRAAGYVLLTAPDYLRKLWEFLPGTSSTITQEDFADQAPMAAEDVFEHDPAASELATDPVLVAGIEANHAKAAPRVAQTTNSLNSAVKACLAGTSQTIDLTKLSPTTTAPATTPATTAPVTTTPATTEPATTTPATTTPKPGTEPQQQSSSRGPVIAISVIAVIVGILAALSAALPFIQHLLPPAIADLLP